LELAGAVVEVRGAVTPQQTTLQVVLVDKDLSEVVEAVPTMMMLYILEQSYLVLAGMACALGAHPQP
jgi:hypothetical protein